MQQSDFFINYVPLQNIFKTLYKIVEILYNKYKSLNKF